MKFVLAPDKFKGSLTGFEFCDAVEEGLRMVFKDAEIIKIPLADGGDGTIDVVESYSIGDRITLTVNDPLMRPVQASYLFSSEKSIAFIEMTEASGLKLLQDSERNCMLTSSFGTGELIANALNNGAKEIVLGIGGSATNDGGMGIANALGIKFLDGDNDELKPIGRNLIKVKKIDATKIHPKLSAVQIDVACDVANPFYGEDGAAKVYAAQKGATADDIEILDNGLHNFAKVIQDYNGFDVQRINGSGAAGGIGGGAVAFLGGRLTSGIDLIKGLSNFDAKISNADWIITGEGQLDEQTLSGKTIGGVVASASKKSIPVAALCGSVDLSVKKQEALGLTYVSSILRGVSTLNEAMDASYNNLVISSYNFARLLQ